MVIEAGAAMLRGRPLCLAARVGMLRVARIQQTRRIRDELARARGEHREKQKHEGAAGQAHGGEDSGRGGMIKARMSACGRSYRALQHGSGSTESMRRLSSLAASQRILAD